MVSNPDSGADRYPFRFAPSMARFSAVFGVRPATAWVELSPAGFSARFGPWSVQTPIGNIAATSITGPYSWAKVVGPARLSLGDRGVTFATNPDAGVCIELIAPVSIIVPGNLLRSPNLTVTVADPAALVAALQDHRSS